jgi:DNA-binding MarR family transcriptional regulator
MKAETLERPASHALLELPCACRNLPRLTRIVPRIDEQEIRKEGLAITLGLLTALATEGRANQKRLSAGFVMDGTRLTRSLSLLVKAGWVQVQRGKDRRERLFRLTRAGKRPLAEAQPYWESAEQRLQRNHGDVGWKSMKESVWRSAKAAAEARIFLRPNRCIYI